MFIYTEGNEKNKLCLFIHLFMIKIVNLESIMFFCSN